MPPVSSDLALRGALWSLASLHFLVCLPIPARLLRDAPPRAATGPSATATAVALRQLLTGAPFLLVGAFIMLFMDATVTLPDVGYRFGVGLLLVMSLGAIAMLLRAHRRALATGLGAH